MEINHFSHEEHTLIVKELKEEDNKKVVCSGCKNPISGSTYCCSKCEVFLHKSCAELPLEITHPMHPEHPLKLYSESPYDQSTSCKCAICRRELSGFTYHCCKCEFDLDVSCAQLEGTFNHPGHHHPLKLQQRSALFFCDACGTEEKDQSYYCTKCSFWIHKTCGSLLDSSNHKGHPGGILSVAYCLPEDCREYKLTCDICRGKLHTRYWVYHCGPCRYVVHLKCMTSKSQGQEDEAAEASSNGKIPPNSISLPVDVVSSQLIQYYLAEKVLPPIEQLPYIKHFSHDHPLILSYIQDDYSEMYEDDQETVCSGCVEPISGPCYGCTQCNYFIHLYCSQLPKEVSHVKHPEHILSLNHCQEFFHCFECSCCMEVCNGFFYGCKSCPFSLDIKCALLPSTINHKAHCHRLVQGQSLETLLCDACNYVHKEIFFSCKICGYNLAMTCALLPGNVGHRWDKHPFKLSFPPFFYHPGKFMCDICEKEIHPKFWLYHCRKCDNSFHLHCIPRLGKYLNSSDPTCIPRLGKYPKMKFRGELQIDYHPHPLTFTREVKYKFCCAKCGKDLEGRTAFECEPCYFNLCVACVWKIVHVVPRSLIRKSISQNPFS